MNPTFNHEDCLLKHHVRYSGWLPLCKSRLKAIRAAGAKNRRLRYFTFCATGAIDVYMLLVEKVLKKSKQDFFDTVVFFELTPENVVQTQKAIPGAIGFPGNFTEILAFGEQVNDVVPQADPLDYSLAEKDRIEVRDRQRMRAQRQEFSSHFPFDVLNLDLQEYLFRPRDQLPGKLINAIRQVLEWQKLPVTFKNSNAKEYLQGFSFMFTTRVGPENMSADYRDMLLKCLSDNIARDAELVELLAARTGAGTPAELLASDFETFFKFAVPKILLNMINDKDWYVDPNEGVKTFEFEREDGNGPYRMLHFIADIRRKTPPEHARAPGTQPAEAVEAYGEVARMIFSKPEEVVNDNSIDSKLLKSHLDRVKEERARTQA